MKIYFILVILLFSTLVRSENHTTYNVPFFGKMNSSNSTNSSSTELRFKPIHPISVPPANNQSLNESLPTNTSFQTQGNSTAIPTTIPMQTILNEAVKSSGLETSAIVGIIAAAAAVVVIGIGVTCYCHHAKKGPFRPEGELVATTIDLDDDKKSINLNEAFKEPSNLQEVIKAQ